MRFIYDSGPIYEGMLSYDQPFPDFKIRELEHPDWLEFKAYSRAFDGFSMVTGTYIDGPAHCLGLKKAGPIHEIRLFVCTLKILITTSLTCRVIIEEQT